MDEGELYRVGLMVRLEDLAERFNSLPNRIKNIGRHRVPALQRLVGLANRAIDAGDVSWANKNLDPAEETVMLLEELSKLHEAG